jgi:enoyl-CoA hydratase/carnithine racemase
VGIERAKELFFTGKVLAADEAGRIGPVTFVGEPAEVDIYLPEFLAGLRQCSPERLTNRASRSGNCLTWSKTRMSCAMFTATRHTQR